MSPTASNRITIIAAPGSYNFEIQPFILDTEYIDLVSLDGNRSVILNSTQSGNIYIVSNNVFVKGIETKTLPFIIENDLDKIKIVNCKGGDYSFNCSILSGTFIDCEGGNYSFYGNDVSGTFVKCKGGNYSFGYNASGDFIECEGESYSFGGGDFYLSINGIASGNFTNCIGGVHSFGGYSSIASGVFNNCKGAYGSFGGGEGEASGTFNNCQGNDSSFGGYGIASGIFNNCTGDWYSFGGGAGNYGIASGNFTNCIGGLSSFGGYISSGIFTNCIGGASSFFSTNSDIGIYNYCIADGGFDNSGIKYFCKLTYGTFPNRGRRIYCIDGNNNTNNN